MPLVMIATVQFSIPSRIKISKFVWNHLFSVMQAFLIFRFVLQEIGAISCMIRKPDGKLKGYNVDYLGAIAAIEEGLRGLDYITSYALLYFTFWVDQFNISNFYMQHQMVQAMDLVPHWLVNCLLSWELVVLERHLLLVEKKRERES